MVTKENTFPTLSGETLTGDKKTFPDDLKNKVNILILVFNEPAQYKVDTWAKMILSEYEPLEEVSYHEVPMLSGWYKPLAWQIDRWMRDGIPDKYHGNTVTFYGNRKPYIMQLGLTDENSCYLFVLDDHRHILHRSEGIMDTEKENKLRSIIKERIL